MIKRVKVAKLRFRADDGSEFPEWKEKRVSDVFTKVRTKNIEQKITNVITNSAEYGLIHQKDFFDKNIAVDGNTDNYTIILTGDFVYNPRKSKQAPYGPFNCYELPEVGIVSPLYTCLRPIGNENTKYLYWYFQTNKWHRFIYENGAQNGARHDRVGMTDELMKDIPVSVPSLPEQQKIASFLSTIDEIIQSTESELTAWQERKKGVMQKIFNREVRFKADDGSEFPEWEEKRLGELYCKNVEKNTELKFESSRTISIASMQFNEKGNGANEDSLSSYKVLRLGDIAFEGHENKEYSHGRFVLNDIGDGIMSPRFSCMRPVCTQEYGFWKYYIHSEMVMRNILVRSTKKGTMMHELVISDFLKQSINVPLLPEQRKIADCLSSLDDVINQIKAELSAWKEFKKGLLQQMFV